VLLIGRRLARRVQGPRGPQVPDHAQRHTAPRLHESRTRLAIAEDCTGIPTRLQGSASDTPAPFSCHLTCYKPRPAPGRTRTNCRQVQHWTEDLFDRLDRHASGHGARLVAVIWQAGIGFTLIRICEGTRRTERAIKNAGGAVRYCPACTSRPWTGHWQAMPADFTPRTYPNLTGRR
jgi:hypothetical protein